MNILTFDIEEWFHLLGHDSIKNENTWINYEYRINENIDRILELLDKRNQKATFFCLGWIARKFPEVINRINFNNHEIGTHSDLHMLAFEQTRKSFKEDLSRSIHSIQDLTGKKIDSYRAPGFSIKRENKWVFEELIKEGIEFDCSIFASRRDNGGFRQFPISEPCIIKKEGSKIKEFPINTFKFLGSPFIFSGGGYFRLLPYSIIKSLTLRSNYVMTYFHPRDFDVNQPIITDLNKIRKFKSYYGIDSAFIKLEKLLNDFDFINLSEANKRINWKKAATVNLDDL